jgi:hypothetical protein
MFCPSQVYFEGIGWSPAKAGLVILIVTGAEPFTDNPGLSELEQAVYVAADTNVTQKNKHWWRLSCIVLFPPVT